MIDSFEETERIEEWVDATILRTHLPGRRLNSTYRLQLTKDFTFADAAAIVPYLHDLGISHVYCSPYLEARPGSTHGYDVCNHGRLNPELGGEEGFTTFVATLTQHGMSHIVDIVPNHMSATPFNEWWNNVLENGPSSPFAGFFDIDWRPLKVELNNKVMLPILGKQYGEILSSREMAVEQRDGSFVLRYCDHVLPLGPETTLPLLRSGLEALTRELGETSEDLLEYQSILTALAHLPLPTDTTPAAIAERQREKEVIKRRLRDLQARSPAIAASIQHAVLQYSPGSQSDEAQPEKVVSGESSIDRLDSLLNQQSYRLCYWRSASDEINYRRFFDVNELAALCMESPQVFARAHALIGRLLGEGNLVGLRIDHIDGLFSPEKYLLRLQWLYLAALAHNVWKSRPIGSPSPAEDKGETWNDLAPALLRRLCQKCSLSQPESDDLWAVLSCIDPELIMPSGESSETIQVSPSPPPSAPAQSAPLPVYVEKILGPDEPLPAGWPMAGSTGYDALNFLNGLFVSPKGLHELVRTYTRFLGETMPYDKIVYDCKLLILRFSMSSELQMLAHRLNRISEQHRDTRDFTLNMLRHALREILACFPVYRVYAQTGHVSQRDQQVVNQAVARAKRRNPAVERTVFDFISDVLLLQHPPGLSASAIQEREFFAGRFQQVTSPVAAKGVEDTAFYVYCPLISANEVGGDPYHRPTLSIANFHQENVARSLHSPSTLIATSTHDTKRSEDVRARIDVLSEMAAPWRKSLGKWARLNKRHCTQVDAQLAPSRNDQYLFYQTLAGVWPLTPVDELENGSIIARLQAYMKKATHEAKQHTSWVNSNPAYDQAVERFVSEVLRFNPDNRFLTDFAAFQNQMLAAGLFTALAQTALKLTIPGIPDIYQGQELWDFSLVDPDNRRAVDYAQRSQWLAEMQAAHQLGPQAWHDYTQGLAENPRDPRLKLLVHWRLLQLRREKPELFLTGSYEALTVTGPLAEHVVAFQRVARADEYNKPARLIVLVARFYTELLKSPGGEPLRPVDTAVWADAMVELPGVSGSFVDALTGRELLVTGYRASVSDVFQTLPIAALVAI